MPWSVCVAICRCERHGAQLQLRLLDSLSRSVTNAISCPVRMTLSTVYQYISTASTAIYIIYMIVPIHTYGYGMLWVNKHQKPILLPAGLDGSLTRHL